MSENATHFIIHHYLDSSSLNFTGMICCVILIAFVVVLLVILIGILIYVIIHSEKCRCSRKAPRTKKSKRCPERYVFENVVDDTSSCNANSHASTARDLDEDNNPNAQSIPLSTFKSKTTDKRGDSSESSAGLYDVLFPEQHNGDILYDPPRKLVTFAGQVYASNSDRAESETGPSGSGRNCEAASGSLEWDYFQQNSPAATESSDIDLEVDPTQIYDVCWV